jgi:hypothetical protein
MKHLVPDGAIRVGIVLPAPGTSRRALAELGSWLCSLSSDCA